MIVSGAQQINSAIRIYVLILPWTLDPSRLPHNIEQILYTENLKKSTKNLFKQIIKLGSLQALRAIYKNQVYFYILAINIPKNKLRKHFHLQWNKILRSKFNKGNMKFLLWKIWNNYWKKLKNLPAVWETQFWSLGQEDTLEEEIATHSSILAWEIPWTENLVG